MAAGNPPARYDVALGLDLLAQVIEYEPADLTITVEAGMTLGALADTLAAQGQFLPIDAPMESCVGGVLATGASGVSRHAYGLPRDWLIGCRVAHADGSMTHAGGRVVKNVAGYDMPKLYTGSLGTLGVIVEATFKVAPLPVAERTLLAEFSSSGDALNAIAGANDLVLASRGIAFRQRLGRPPVVAFWLAGARAAVDRSEREIAALCPGATTERTATGESLAWWTELLAFPYQGETIVRVSLRPTDVPSLLEVAQRQSDAAGVQTEVVAYPTTGLAYLSIRADDIGAIVSYVLALRTAATRMGGSVVVMSAPTAVKERVDAWGDVSAIEVMRRLKQHFDPNSTLCPGRFAGGI
jgi:glycolate oxidase FAD binding subunit